MPTQPDTTIINHLQNIVGTDKVRTDPADLDTFGKDWTKIYQPEPLVIVFPTTIEHVQAIVKLANKHAIGIVPSGGRTGLSAGAVAKQHEIVMAFDYMNKIVDFNATDRTVVCQPGVVTKQIQQFAIEKDLFYPVDFASSGSSQIGGNIATNAGGIKVIRYGLTRDWITGLKVVTGTGELLDLNKGLIKNATGYDLRHLFIGSEGTLGVTVEASVRLTRRPIESAVMILGVPEFSALMNVLETFQHEMDLTAFEFFSEQAVKCVTTHSDIARPFATKTPYYALLEFELISPDTHDMAMQLFNRCLAKEWVVDGVMSQSDTQAHNLWSLRENISESLAQYTPYKNDISVVVSKAPEFLDAVDSVVNQHYPDFTLVWFGHIGDGNLHLNILKPDNLDKTSFFAKCEHVNSYIFEIVQQFNGSVSAEHGVGLVKKNYLHYSRSETEINYMRALKKVFDPNRIMNPGKLFD